MKKILYIVPLFALLGSCVTAGSNSGEESGIRTAPARNIKTSSDMNITPEPNSVPDGPEPTMEPLDSINRN